MYIHRATLEDKSEVLILLDDEENIVELPTNFALSMWQNPRFSRASVHEYLQDVKYLCEELQSDSFYEQFSADDSIAIVGTKFIEDYLCKMRERGLKSSTLRKRDAVMKCFFEWLTTAEAGKVRDIDNHPYANNRLKTVAPHKPAPKFLTHIEIADFILNAFINESERCLAHFMYDTGVRVSEIPRLRKVDLPNLEMFHEDLMYLPILIKGSKGRGGQIKERTAIISRPVVERIHRLHNNWKEYRKAEAKYEVEKMPLFLNVQGNEIKKGAIQKKFYAASKKLIERGKLKKKYIHMY